MLIFILIEITIEWLAFSRFYMNVVNQHACTLCLASFTVPNYFEIRLCFKFKDILECNGVLDSFLEYHLYLHINIHTWYVNLDVMF